MKDFVEPLLLVMAKYEIHCDVWWNEEMEFFVGCNDMFWWACADAEPIETIQEVLLLDKCCEDTGGYNTTHGPLLYCCRRRGLRPQGAAYKYIDEEYWDVFNAAGPEREIDFGNPRPIPDRKEANGD